MKSIYHTPVSFPLEVMLLMDFIDLLEKESGILSEKHNNLLYLLDGIYQDLQQKTK